MNQHSVSSTMEFPILNPGYCYGYWSQIWEKSIFACRKELWLQVWRLWDNHYTRHQWQPVTCYATTISMALMTDFRPFKTFAPMIGNLQTVVRRWTSQKIVGTIFLPTTWISSTSIMIFAKGSRNALSSRRYTGRSPRVVEATYHRIETSLTLTRFNSGRTEPDPSSAKSRRNWSPVNHRIPLHAPPNHNGRNPSFLTLRPMDLTCLHRLPERKRVHEEGLLSASTYWCFHWFSWTCHSFSALDATVRYLQVSIYQENEPKADIAF